MYDSSSIFVEVGGLKKFWRINPLVTTDPLVCAYNNYLKIHCPRGGGSMTITIWEKQTNWDKKYFIFYKIINELLSYYI